MAGRKRVFFGVALGGLAVATAAFLALCLSARGQTERPAAAKGESLVIDHTRVDADDKIIPKDALDKARNLKVLFGHESVGFNVLQGLERLGRQSPERYRLDIGHTIEASWYQQHAGLGEFFVRNANNVPGKARAFEAKLRGGVGEAVAAASLKLCWADLQQSADPDAAFKSYVGVMEEMQKAYPRVRFVYWTVPLRREAILQDKRLRFNELMYAYVKEHNVILFDIADIECHKPDGTEFRNETGKKAMWDGYTNDGGHLNDAGSARVARAWWWLTARLAGWAGPR